MLWIKRNLLFVVGLLVAVGLLAFAIVRLLGTMDQDKQVRDGLEEEWGQLANLYRENPFPDTANIGLVRQDQKRLRQFVQQARDCYQPIPPIHYASQQGFKTELERLVYQLNAIAKSNKIALPTNYYYSFQAQRTLIKFAPGSLEPISRQMAHIQRICAILYDAKIQQLESVQRARISDDDTEAGDLIQQTIQTNAVAVVTPYRVNFRCFSSELAAVVDGLVNSPNGFVIKTIDLIPGSEGVPQMPAPSTPPPGAMDPGQPAPPAAMDPGQPAPAPVLPPVRLQPYRRTPGGGRASRFPTPPVVAPPTPGAAPTAPVTAVPGKVDAGGLKTLLNERAFRVSILLNVVSMRQGSK
ncbi:MAG: Amuc_1100 family pilus-like protein [Verrucomicrobiota bacterium]